ncbi:MAG: chemoreceptor glutamine deamidase CheD [Janthinobacterium lividum]
MKGLPHANHFYQDTDFGKPGVKLLMNEFYVTSEDMVLNTVLGSCVSACIRDPGTGIGGMNHFMLPDESGDPSRDSSDAMRYGAYAMEVLINELIKGGARRSGLEAKVFGGAAVLKRMHTLNIGEDNSRFVRRYLALENIRIVAEDLEGEHPRKVCFMPATGRVMVRKLPLDVRVPDPQARSASIALEQRERAMAEQMRALGERRAQPASGTAAVFGRGDVQTRNAAVLARPAAVAPRVELFIRRPAAPAAKPSGKPDSATPAAAKPLHEAL